MHKKNIFGIAFVCFARTILFASLDFDHRNHPVAHTFFRHKIKQWHQLSFVRNPLISPIVSAWQLASPLGTIPSAKNLRLRFSNSSMSDDAEVIYYSRYMLFIDDIILTGTKKNVSNDVFETASIKIYPNPVTNGILNFQITEANDVNVELFDITGKRVLSGKTTNKSFDVSSLKAGVYFIKIKEYNQLFTQKIIIIK